MSTYLWLVAAVGGLLALARVPRTAVVGAGAGDPAAERTPLTVVDLAVAGVLVAFAGLRWSVGTDWGMYAREFVLRTSLTDLPRTLAHSDMEGGFVVLAWLVRHLGDDPRLLFTVVMLLTVAPVVLVARRSARSPGVFVLLWLLIGPYLASLNVVRQGLAAAVWLLAVTVFGRRPVLYAVLAAVAVSVHTSAVLAAVAHLVVTRLRFSWTLTWCVVAAGVVVGWATTHSTLVAGLASALNSRYASYLGGTGAGTGTLLVLGAKVCLLLAIQLVTRRHVLDAFDRILVLLTAVGVAFIGAGLTSLWLVRMDLFFCAAAPLLLARLHARGVVPARLLVPGLLAAVAFYASYVANFAGLLPYAARGWW